MLVLILHRFNCGKSSREKAAANSSSIKLTVSLIDKLKLQKLKLYSFFFYLNTR